MKILILLPGYYPAKNYGGPVISIQNFTTLLGNNYECYIITKNYEFKTNKKLTDINDGWNKIFNANVIYLSKKEFNYKEFFKITNEVNPNLIYVNSFFNYKMLLYAIAISKKKNITILLAPRGELCKNALDIKKTKKMIYIILLKRILNSCKIFYQSTSAEETNAIIKYLKVSKSKVKELTNIPTICNDINNKKAKIKGRINAIFVSRIHPKKNLSYLIDCLSEIKGKVKLDIYGPKEDIGYWNKVQFKISSLPKNIQVSYCGNLEHEEIIPTMMKYEFFLFYTLSENYGHVIAEAINSLCVPVISNKTPWNDLEKYNAGFIANIDNKKECIEKLQAIVDMDSEQYNHMIDNLKKYCNDKIDIKKTKKEYIEALGSIINGKD